MPVNNVSNNQAQADTPVRQAQRNENKAADDSKKVQDNKAAAEDVKVTLNSKNKKAEAKTRTTENARPEPEQRPRENRNVESRRAIQAYENTRKIAEANTARPETATRRQINRVVGA